MGFITNQWLKGSVERNRDHHPIRVTLGAGESQDDWSMRNKVSRNLLATRENGYYQEIYLTKGELNSVVPLLATGASIAVRKQVAMNTITDLDDVEFVAFINSALSRRIAAKRKGNGKK